VHPRCRRLRASTRLELDVNWGLAAQDGVILVDHGSRVAESNEALLVVAQRFRATLGHPIVEPAHMELAEPSISLAVDRCVGQGATRIVVVPFFLLPGRHWRRDIPNLTQEACARHGHMPYLVTAPLGDAQGVVDVLIGRMASCLSAAEANRGVCEVCQPGPACWQRSLPSPVLAEDKVRRTDQA
jgi:sirohydrochlorin ferrochelatase